MRAGFTKAVCLGCGKQNERKKDSVCPECLENIETGKKYNQLYESLRKDKSIVECQVPFGWDGPRFSTFRSNQQNESLAPLGEILTELSQVVSMPAGQKISYGYMSHLINKATFSVDDGAASGYDLPVVYIDKKNGRTKKFGLQHKAVMPKRIFDCLHKLCKAIDVAILETEKGAVEYGKNALIMLNDGKITMDDFNKA